MNAFSLAGRSHFEGSCQKSFAAYCKPKKFTHFAASQMANGNGEFETEMEMEMEMGWKCWVHCGHKFEIFLL